MRERKVLLGLEAKEISETWLPHIQSALEIRLTDKSTNIRSMNYAQLRGFVSEKQDLLRDFNSILNPNIYMYEVLQRLVQDGASSERQISEMRPEAEKMLAQQRRAIKAELNKLKRLGIVFTQTLDYVKPVPVEIFVAPFATDQHIKTATDYYQRFERFKEIKITEKAEIEFESKKRAARGLEKEFEKTPAQIANKRGKPVLQIQRYDCTVCKFSHQAVREPEVCSHCRNRGKNAFVRVPAD